MQTVLLVILAGIISLGLVLFQYYYRTKKRGNLSFLLSFLRFIAFFGLFLLLINPKFSKNTYTLEKPNLLLLTDNSSSVKSSEEIIRALLDSFKGNREIADNFNSKEYVFGSDIEDLDSLSFSGRNTDISKAIASLNDIYANTNSAIVIITDGNQTLGSDYAYLGKEGQFPIYPIVVGDTTTFEDLWIDQVNANRYAFLKNRFPVEAYISYQGNRTVNATINIEMDGKIVHRENVEFSSIHNAKTINSLVEAGSVGPKSIRVKVSALDNERNTKNNQKNLPIDVIDEKTNIGIVSAMLHPDLGALKRAIETNGQRAASIVKPNVDLRELEDVDLFILYQPDPSFRPIYEYVQKRKVALFTITGEKVDLNFVNKVQKTFRINGGYPVMETYPVLDPAFSKFDLSDFSVEGFPPLSNGAGIIDAQNAETLLQMKVKGATMTSPLLAVSDEDHVRQAFLFGENLWKWRMQSYKDAQNFKNFDDFMGKLILYLTSSKPKNRLQVDYKAVYEGSNEARISATYVDEGFEFDPNATISVKVREKENGFEREMPMLLKSSYYEADLSGLSAGAYDFTVNVRPENRSMSGKFTILDFDLEAQFPSSNYKKLSLLANNTNGRIFFPSQVDSLLKSVGNDAKFRPIQSSVENVVSLIDFRLLLGFIVAALALEWFIRKFNGLI